jgi:hypothetical protein
MSNNKFLTSCIALFCLMNITNAQSDTARVLFIGNSYTSVNNLPAEFSACAASAGYNTIVSSSAPGGYTFQQHLSNATTIGLIQQGGWDFVVLQEQSQIPSFPISQVQSDCFPFAAALNDSIEKYAPCGETVFYQTWGRQNGDSQNCANWPPVCTYEGMDSLLQERYQMMANDHSAIVAAVAAVRRYLRVHYPNYNLYQADGSHPSALGTYAAACTFTTSIFRVDPGLITYTNNFTIDEVNAVKEAVTNVVFNQLMNWNIGAYDLQVQFTYEMSGDTLITAAECVSCDSIVWSFGDGNYSNELSPQHIYLPGIYSLNMIGYHCGSTQSQTAEIFIEPQTFINEQPTSLSFIVFKNNLVFKQAIQNGEWTLFDISGKKILNFQQQQTNLGFLSPGIYLMTHSKTGQTERLVIND